MRSCLNCKYRGLDAPEEPCISCWEVINNKRCYTGWEPKKRKITDMPESTKPYGGVFTTHKDDSDLLKSEITHSAFISSQRLTIHDYAIAAMNGKIQSKFYNSVNYDELAKESYKLAKAMLEEGKKHE